MFIRSKTVKGRVYYQVVENRRSSTKWGGNGRVKQRVVASLGTHPTIAEAFRASEARYFASPRGGSDRAWERLLLLEALFEEELLLLEQTPYRRSRAMRAEAARRRRAAADRHRAKAEERRRRREARRDESERTSDGDWARFLGMFVTRPSPSEVRSSLALLGLTPPITTQELKAAYHRKARACHPDHGGSHEAMVRLNAAYELLLNEAGLG